MEEAEQDDVADLVPQEEEQQEQPTYNLESLNEDAMSQMRYWSNMTRIVLGRISPLAPQWSEMLGDVHNFIMAEAEKHKL